MRLSIDTREKPLDLIRVIRRVVGEEDTEVVKLECADYAVGTVLGVERKRLGNLVSSMVTPRGDTTELWDQLERCLVAYSHVVLLIEGTLEAVADPKLCVADGRWRKVPYMSVVATLAKVQEKGVMVLWTANVHETSLVLKWLHTVSQRPGWLSRSTPTVE